MNEVYNRARDFIFTHARLLERRLYQVHFNGESPDCIGQIVRAYQNSDGGLGHALEPDVRCPESQPIFVNIGLAALAEAKYRDAQLAKSLCNYLQSVSDNNGLVPFFSEIALQSPIAAHWMEPTTTPGFNPIGVPGFNPTAEICGYLHYQGVQHDWLSLATDTCCNMILNDPTSEAHYLFCASRLVEYLADRKVAMNILDVIASLLPESQFFISAAPVNTYGLTPLHFAPEPDSIFRPLFTKEQIDGHLEDLVSKQEADGGWPISWEAPGPASVLEWRGRWTLDAICRLVAYGVINNE
ncbi:MAG TPA: hypothetical protein G4O10_03535 [Dehalococcoidia bacterium]|nr:hypothetical protein [Dehalococcoidia bacterium]